MSTSPNSSEFIKVSDLLLTDNELSVKFFTKVNYVDKSKDTRSIYSELKYNSTNNTSTYSYDISRLISCFWEFKFKSSWKDSFRVGFQELYHVKIAFETMIHYIENYKISSTSANYTNTSFTITGAYSSLSLKLVDPTLTNDNTLKVRLTIGNAHHDFAPNTIFAIYELLKCNMYEIANQQILFFQMTHPMIPDKKDITTRPRNNFFENGMMQS